MDFPCVSARVFAAIQNLNIIELGKCPQHEIRPLLPCLVRMSLLSSMDNSKSGLEIRKQILSLLVGIEDVNNIVSLLQVDYHELEIDVKKEQQLRQKINNSNQDSAQFHSLQNGVALGFERADVTRKVRIVLSELFYIQSQIIEQNQQLNQMMAGGGGGVGGVGGSGGSGPGGLGLGVGGVGVGGGGLGGGMGGGGSGSGSTISIGSNNQMGRNINDNIIKQSELFDNEIYLAEITDIICIALAELPSLFNIQEVIETLLYVNYGASIICWVVSNMPDCFKEVIGSLIGNGDEDTPEGRLRAQVLYALCDMNPGQSLPTRTLCVELSKMPSLMLKLSLKDPLDLVAFISGLLLGNDQNTRSWFAVFVRTSQKRKGGALQTVREELIKQLQNTEIFTLNSQSDEAVVQAAALLRLYCALRGIAGIKFNDDEVSCIMKLITSRPPPTPAGIRFVSLGLCMLLACPSLIALPSIELKAVEWIQWLVKEEPYFESNSGVASFGEMLLLMAIHFHSNQTAAICELVCSTLGMKIPLRPNNTSRMKQIFTTDIFTEQVVTAHAVKVPVTLNLNANITGYLPVHCIHQLLKSRAFTKHKVPIKSWIYKQICATTSPLHPVMPALIEVYINSIIAPNAKGSNDHTHKPLSEDEILKVFQSSIVGVHLEVKKKTDIDTKLMVSGGVAEITSNNNTNNNNDNSMIQPSVMSQLLLLYYLLLYEDVRLSHAATILANGRKVKAYSTEFLIELPIKFLLQQAQRSQNECSGLFSPLLRLVIAHFPHLSLVDDWLDLEEITSPMIRTAGTTINPQHLDESFNELKQCPLKIIKLMRLMLSKAPIDLWPFAELFTKYIKSILDRDTPRLIQELYRKVWLRLNTVLPRRLWTMTMNALMVNDDPLKFYTYGQETQLMDPLQVLRCDERVFRCPDLLQIVLRILRANMESSKCQLMRLIMDKPLLDKTQHAEQEREDLRNKLVGVQSSAAIHILLDACLETDDDRRHIGNGWALREIRGIICSHLHQWFIAYPACAKLIHFQGYPRELLMVTVRGIPSMHICTDWIPELLNTTEMEKQIFAIDLTSHLSLKYSFPNVLSQAKLCVNALTTLLGHLTNDIRIEMFRSVLPCIVRFAEAFPPLLEECTIFLMQLGRIAESQAALGRQLSLATLSLSPCSRIREQTKQSQLADRLVEEVRATFTELLNASVLKTKIY